MYFIRQHLSQMEKRCQLLYKTFFSVRALSEEAIELDKNNDGSEIMYHISL